MKTILLTGAGGGIGTAIKEALESEGHRVIPVHREDADLSKYSDIEKLEAKIAKGVAALDWIVCAHGYIDTETDLEKQEPGAIADTFDINIVSIVSLTKLFLKHLTPGGGMLFLSSSAGITANGKTAAYSASKAAVNNFAEGMARNRSEFTFISICPGPTNTPMRDRIAGDAATKQSPSIIAATALRIISGETDYQSGDIILIKDGEESLHSRIG